MKTLRFVFIALALLASAFIYFRFYYTKSFSPSSTASFSKNGLDISVDYCQPSKKGRLIFGTEQQKALVPYGKWWRTGANEATVIKFNKNVIVGDKTLEAGTYTLFTIPTATDWTIIINSEVGQWGLSYNPAKDVLKTQVPSFPKNDVQEMFLIDFTERPDGANMVMHWDTTEVVIPITVKP